MGLVEGGSLQPAAFPGIKHDKMQLLSAADLSAGGIRLKHYDKLWACPESGLLSIHQVYLLQ